MAIRIKALSTVPAGTYPATFLGLEAKESREGNPYYRWSFEASTTNGVREVSGVSSPNTGPKAKAYRWLAGLIGRRPGPDELIDENKLIGQACLIVVEENDDGFGNVVEVLPPARLSDAAVAAYADQADAELADLPF
jgi:hypothetical protein